MVFEFLTEMNIKAMNFRDVTLCCLVDMFVCFQRNMLLPSSGSVSVVYWYQTLLSAYSGDVT